MSTVPLNRKGHTNIFGQDGFTVVKLYATDVVKFNDSTIILNSGGWLTATTKQRMKQASKDFQLGFNVYQEKGNWFVSFNGKVIPFVDGMTIDRLTN